MIFANLASLLPTDTSALERCISALESSISALERSIAAIDASLPFWEWIGFVGAALVAIGVLLEIKDIRHRHAEDWTIWRLSYFGVFLSSARPQFLRKYGVELASVILVAGGVVVELGAGLMIESMNTALRAIDIRSRSMNSELRSKSNQLVEALRKETEDEHTARVAAEESVAWRKLGPRARSTLASKLRAFPVERTWLSYNLGDTEAFTFGEELGTALQSANWHPTDPESVMKMFLGPVSFGTNKLPLGIVVKGTIGCEKAAKALVQELVNAGFDATALPPVPLGSNPEQAVRVNTMRAGGSGGMLPTVLVSIEPRPEGPQGEAKLRADALKKKQAESTQSTKP